MVNNACRKDDADNYSSVFLFFLPFDTSERSRFINKQEKDFLNTNDNIILIILCMEQIFKKVFLVSFLRKFYKKKSCVVKNFQCKKPLELMFNSLFCIILHQKHQWRYVSSETSVEVRFIRNISGGTFHQKHQWRYVSSETSVEVRFIRNISGGTFHQKHQWRYVSSETSVEVRFIRNISGSTFHQKHQWRYVSSETSVEVRFIRNISGSTFHQKHQWRYVSSETSVEVHFCKRARGFNPFIEISETWFYLRFECVYNSVHYL